MRMSILRTSKPKLNMKASVPLPRAVQDLTSMDLISDEHIPAGTRSKFDTPTFSKSSRSLGILRCPESCSSPHTEVASYSDQLPHASELTLVTENQHNLPSFGKKRKRSDSRIEMQDSSPSSQNVRSISLTSDHSLTAADS